MDNKREELLSEILRRVQRNCVRMIEIERLTKELGDALSRNDQESAQLLIKMRQEEIESSIETKNEIRMLLPLADGEEGERIRGWLAGENKNQPDSFEEKKILELSSQMAVILNRTISIDKVINQKLAGEDSYYQKAK